MKHLTITLFLLLLAGTLQAQFRSNALRSDTIDITHFTITLTMTDYAHQVIGGNCEIQFKSKMSGINQLYLDLQKMNIDSITQNGQKLLYTYPDSETLIVTLASLLQTNDSAAVTVYYHGHPLPDAGFGGFNYKDSSYVYNIGVDFKANPQSYGRVWYPCFDNFVERATYDFHITTNSHQMALCNGVLTDSTNNHNGTKTWSWHLSENIPSYLACAAVAAYTPVYFTINGMNGLIPVQLGDIASDTTKMKNSFVHLPNALSIFEQRFGPYRWNKIGYSMVPFTAGAMEHATNIAYPYIFISGSTANENNYAHELSHHWFGDLVTCSSAPDMWLNEGWARYCEKIFYEGVYGHIRYATEVANSHEQVLHYTHVVDSGYRALSPIPHNFTYGFGTYEKGSDVVHTLRSYMGDSLFFHCVKNYLTDNAFTSQSSITFRDYLKQCSSISLDDFFNDWVFAPGFPQFSIDTFIVTSSQNNYQAAVYIRQKLDHAPAYYNNVPLEITFMDKNWNSFTTQVMVSGACGVYYITVPFNPVFACTDFGAKISDAITEDYNTIRTTGTYNFVNGKMNVIVNSITDSVFLRIEHNFVAPDPMKHPIPGLHLSTERYWRVDGIIPSGFNAKAIINYDGSTPPTTVSIAGAYLDNKLITSTEDSLVVMYRPSVSADWQVDSDVVLNVRGTANDKKGSFTINNLKKGEYTLAIYQQNKVDSLPAFSTQNCFNLLGVENLPVVNNDFTVYPNPSNGMVTIQGSFTTNCSITIFNVNGQIICQKYIPAGSLNLSLDTREWGKGLFLVKIASARYVTVKKQIVIN